LPADHENRRRRRCGQRARAFLNWAQERQPDATGYLALGTWALALVSYIALEDGRDALRLAAEANRTARETAAAQIKEMAIQAAAMQGQLDAYTADAAIRKSVLSPKMSQSFRFDNVLENGKLTAWNITPTWRNTGPTDAVDWEGWDKVLPFTPDAPQDYDFTRIPINPSEMVPFAVAPGDGTAQQTVTVTMDDAEKALVGETTVVFWGRIE